MAYNEKILNDVIRQVFISHRHQKGLTQFGLAQILKTTRQFISQVEVGKRLPSLYSVTCFTTALNISLADFFAEVDSLYKLKLQKCNGANIQNAGDPMVP